MGWVTRRRDRRFVPAVLAAVAILAASCGDAGDAGSSDAGIEVVATTTILGDVVQQLVGTDGQVQVLVPIGADPHDYQASSQQVAAIQRADLVVANGLGLEEPLLDILDAAEVDGANILLLAPLLDPIPFGSHGGDIGQSLDPHVWLDPIRMAEGAKIIGAELTTIDPSVDWSERANDYADELTAADSRIQDLLAVLPDAGRKLVSNHDALGYFADRYGFEVVGVVIPGGSTLGEPSSSEISALVDTIEASGVTALFADTTEPTTLADAVAQESGGRVEVVELYTGSLGEPGSGADTLIGMLVTNAERIAGALS